MDIPAYRILSKIIVPVYTCMDWSFCTFLATMGTFALKCIIEMQRWLWRLCGTASFLWILFSLPIAFFWEAWYAKISEGVTLHSKKPQHNTLNRPTKQPRQSTSAVAVTPHVDTKRIVRLLQMVQEIRNAPRQSFDAVLTRFKISRSQFYKDRALLAEIGFRVEYNTRSGFLVTEDRLTPVTDFSLSDRVVLMFALEHLSACAEGHLAAQAVEVGRKLAGGLVSPFREQLQACFDRRVTEEAFGVQPHVLTTLREAIAEGRWVCILYQRSETWETRWREVAPRRIYLRHRTLYLYARTQDETSPQWKVFRLGRIKEVALTGVCAPINPHEDDGFEARQSNAFGVFIGDKTETVRVHFTGNARNYVKERVWHPSQIFEETEDGGLVLTVTVAEPQEVVRWARTFGDGAKVVLE